MCDYDENPRDYHIETRAHTSRIGYHIIIIHFKPQNIKYMSLLTYLILNTHFFILNGILIIRNIELVKFNLVKSLDYFLGIS